MNCCHLCSIVAKKQQIISCSNCSNQYCFKCIKLILSQPKVQKQVNLDFRVFPQHSIQQIQEKFRCKKWICFSCLKVCICKTCQGVGMKYVEKIILGKKDKIIVKRNINDYKQYYGDLQVLKSVEFDSMNSFEKQYFMNKAMLYARPKNDTVISLKEISVKEIIENERVEKKQDVIMIDSDQNHQNHLGNQFSDPNETIMRDQLRQYNGNASEFIEVQQSKLKNQMIMEESKQNLQNKSKAQQKMSIEVEKSQNHLDK